MGFVGVDTTNSAIMRIFPRWAEHLGLPTRRLRSHDLPLTASPQDYRDLVTSIARDETHLGALVTTHKIGVYAAAHDLFDELDDFSIQCGEISSISKRDARLRGAAKDPLTAGLALDELLGDDWFARTGGEVVCLGAGGAGTAITTHLAQAADRPGRITVTDVDRGRLDHVRTVHDRAGLPPGLFRYVQVASASEVGDLVAGAADGSLVVNATGLGKDRPGSPVPADLVFPRGSAVWEINYRGDLDFLVHARSQEQQQELRVADGWRYFIHGWTQVVAEVFSLEMPPATVSELAVLAER